MKTLLAIMWIAVGTLSCLAQGTVVFNNNVPGKVVSHVYLERADFPNPPGVGNGPNDYPAGFKDWSRAVPIPGDLFSAQLYAEEGGIFVPASQRTTFLTGAEAGFLKPFIATLSGVPADSAAVTLQLRVWYSAWPTWEQAFDNFDPNMVSPSFTIHNVGGNVNPPAYLTGLQSFAVPLLDLMIPEPSSLSLLLVGGAGMLLRRRAAIQRRKAVA